MTFATLVYGVVPLLVDLGGSHVFHPEWTPHSRMHMVWLLGTNSTLAIVALYFLWAFKSDHRLGVRMSLIIGLCVYGGFWISAATLPLYNGALADTGGVPPVMGIDANVLGFGIATGALFVGWFMARGGKRPMSAPGITSTGAE